MKLKLSIRILIIIILLACAVGISPFKLDIRDVKAAIGVTSLGTRALKDAGIGFLISDLGSFSIGDTIVVCWAGDEDPSSVTIREDDNSNPLSLVEDVIGENTGNAISSIWSKTVTVAYTNAEVNFSHSSGIAVCATLYKVTGLDSSPLDLTNYNTGSGTTADTNSTGTLSQADEIVFACVADEDEIDDMTGTWTTGAAYVSGNEQSDGTDGAGDASNMVIYSAAEIVSATDSQAGQVTGMDDTDWAACIASYKMASGTPDISNSPSSKNFSNVDESSSYYFKGTAPNNPVESGDCYFSCTNNSGFTVDLYIQGTNWSGGGGWNLTSGSPSSDETRETMYCVGDNPASGVVLTTSPQLFYEDLADSASIGWDGKLETGTFGDGTTRTQTLTISAQAP